MIGDCHGRHRHQEGLRFLRRLDRESPPELELHVVMDNYGTHKEPHVKAWLKKHPRFVCHFIPTSYSWLNAVERWFAKLSQKAIRRGTFVSVPERARSNRSLLAGSEPKAQTVHLDRHSGRDYQADQLPPSSSHSGRSV